MKNLFAWVSGKKTYIIAALGLLMSLVKFMAGDMPLTEFLNSPEFAEVLGWLGLATLRAGVAKSGPTNTQPPS